MACRAVEIWTITSLAGAYLDLILTYLFLVGATIAFFTSKLLSIFNLSLPCTCDGRFGHPSCAQAALLVDLPAANLAAVHRSLRARFPFAAAVASSSSSSPRCRYAVQCAGEDCDLPPPRPPDSLENECGASAERGSGGFWGSDEDCLEDEAADGKEKDSCNGAGGLIGCDKAASLEMMRSFEKDVEEERGDLVALYLELEKERNAAASAADEAMAMILRLQNEKAEIDMEARQYQRIVEEKSAYVEEEMEILKEIILRRERENHVLEKEVEMYKQMVSSGERVEEEFDIDEKFLEDKLDTLVDSSYDPMLMLQQIYKSVGKKEEPNDFGVESSPIMNSDDQDFQEKTILTTHSTSSSSNILNTRSVYDSVLFNLKGTSETEYHKDITDSTVKDKGQMGTPTESIVSVDGLCKMRSDDDSDQRFNEYFQVETEANILDVHVINDGQPLQFEEDNNQNIIASKEDSSCTNFDEMKLNIRRSCSEITNRISLINSLSGRASCSNLRSLLPSVESERYKIENEVDVLRKRLEVIRQGRENLSFHADQKEKETFQLQLLDEIAFQLKEIKKVTKPTKALRRASLPLSSKFNEHINGEI